MSKQYSVMIEDGVAKKLHNIQTNFQKEYGESISFSEVLNEMLQNKIK